MAAEGKNRNLILAAVQGDFARSTQTVFYVMAGVMALAFLLAAIAMPGGKVEAMEPAAEPAEPSVGPA